MTYPSEPPRQTMAPGFYPDLSDPNVERYWDGAQWTPETRRAKATDAAGSSPKRRNRRVLLIAVAAVVVAAAVAVGLVVGLGGSSTPSRFTMRGTFTLSGTPVAFGNEDGNFLAAHGKCLGANGYEDITTGAQVTVSDEAGKVIAVGKLGIGRVTSGACVFGLLVKSVPGGHKFYKVSVTHRGEVQFTAKQMRAGDVGLTLGS